MCEVGQKARLVCARYNRQSNLNCLLPNIHCRMLAELPDNRKWPPTASPSPYCDVQRSNKVREDSIHLIQPRQDIYYVRTRISVLLREDRGQESCDGLDYQPRLAARDAPGLTSRACASAGALPALMRPTALVNSCRVCTYFLINSPVFLLFHFSLIPGDVASRLGSIPQSTFAMWPCPVSAERTPSSIPLFSHGLLHPVKHLVHLPNLSDKVSPP